MNQQELELILQEGEGYKIEFKENISNIDKNIVAFANSSGGRIFVGITDNKKIKGIKITNKLKSELQDIANKCRPKIKILLEEFKNILIINVREGEDKPYECSSGFYRRIGSNTQKLTRNEIIDLFKSEGKVRFDELTEPKFNFPKDFDREKFDKFLELAGITKTKFIEKVLINLGVIEKQEGKLYFNNTGILFFAKEPQRFVPWSVFTVVLFKDKVGVDVIDRKEIKGSLFEIVDKVMDFIKLYTKVAYRFTRKPQRDNIYEYPFEAIREAVINSVMHKYYFEHGHNNILKVFPDRIMIENYWIKPKNFILRKTVFRMNQLIADLFTRIDFGERLGTGFERIREICKKENAPFPKIEFNENYFYVTFRQSHEYLKMAKPEKFPEKFPETSKKILEIISKNPKITIEEMSHILKVSDRAVKKHISNLKEKGLIKRIGSDRAGYWEIVRIKK